MQWATHLTFLFPREAESRGRLDVYFAPDVGEDSRVLFLRYVHEHLELHAKNVVRFRHYACHNSRCERHGQAYADQVAINAALASGGNGRVRCPGCGRSILLRDRLEKKFEAARAKAGGVQRAGAGRDAFVTRAEP